MSAPRSYVAGTATAVAPVAAIPTTAAHYALWNGEPAGGKAYTITSVSFTPVVSAGAAFVAQLLVHVGGTKSAPAGTIAQGPKPLDGLKADTRAQSLSAVTIAAASGLWHPITPSINAGAATATIALGGYQNVRGIYTLQPGGLFALAVLCSAAGSATCQLYVTWEEA